MREKLQFHLLPLNLNIIKIKIKNERLVISEESRGSSSADLQVATTLNMG